VLAEVPGARVVAAVELAEPGERRAALLDAHLGEAGAELAVGLVGLAVLLGVLGLLACALLAGFAYAGGETGGELLLGELFDQADDLLGPRQRRWGAVGVREADAQRVERPRGLRDARLVGVPLASSGGGPGTGASSRAPGRSARSAEVPSFRPAEGV